MEGKDGQPSEAGKEAGAAAAAHPGTEERKQSDKDGTPDPSQFVNRGLERWEAARQKWIESKNATGASADGNGRYATDASGQPVFSAVPLEVDDVIDVIFAPRWRSSGAHEGPPESFPRPVPLPQMVDILVDLWEAEGLDV